MSKSLFDEATPGVEADDTESVPDRDRADDDQPFEQAAASRLASRPITALVTGTVIGLVGLVVGAGLSSVPSLAIETVLVPVVGVLAVAVGIGWLTDQIGDTVTGGVLPTVEDTATTVPGDEVDEALTTERTHHAPYGERSRIRTRLRALVVASLRHRGHSRTDAERAIDEERWTDDPRAAGFFTIATGGTGWLRRVWKRQSTRLRRTLGLASPFGRAARHTIDAAAHLITTGDREWDDPEQAVESDRRAEGPQRTIALTDRQLATGRVRLIGGLVLVAVGLGVVLREPALILAGAVGTSLLAHRFAGGVPDPVLAVERTVDADDPDPGDVVTVETTVENEGESALWDLRLVDGVPPTLTVADGSPRRYTGLRPGASVTISYDVTVESGRHEFDPVGVLARSASGATERATTVDVEGDTTLTCRPRPAPDVGTPVRTETSRDIGSVVTDTGGAGIEFHSVREYRSGDPLRRIDWRQLARGGELATRQFNVERSTTVVLVIDTRAEAFVTAEQGAPTAVERSVEAAASAVRDLLYSNDRVGLATIGPRRCWVPPRGGGSQWPIVADALATHEAFAHPDPEERFLRMSTLHWLRTRLPDDAQLVLFSPLADDGGLRIARQLQAHGYPLTVVSPATTGTDSPGRLVAHLERTLRLSRLRQVGVTAVDWHGDEPLEAAFDRVRGRWSR